MAEAESANDEGVRLAAEIGRRPYQFAGELLAARLLAAQGQPQQAKARLLQMKAAGTDPEMQAEMTLALWEITGEPSQYRAAKEQFAHLFETTRIARYKTRLVELAQMRAKIGF